MTFVTLVNLPMVTANIGTIRRFVAWHPRSPSRTTLGRKDGGAGNTRGNNRCGGRDRVGAVRLGARPARADRGARAAGWLGAALAVLHGRTRGRRAEPRRDRHRGEL